MLIVALALGLAAWGGIILGGFWADRQAVRSVRDALASGRPVEARQQLEAWLQRRPDSAEAEFLRAEIAFAEGRLNEVEPALERALARGYATRPVERLRAFTLVRQRRYAEAEPILTNLINGSSQPDPELDEACARVLLQTYKLEAAGRVLRKWMADAPRDPRPYLWFAEIDSRTETDAETTIGHYRAALERDPDLDVAHLGLAEVLYAAHRTDEAAREFERYLQRHPDEASVLVRAGLNAFDRGDAAAALGYLDRALKVEPGNAIAWRTRGRIALAEGDLDRAFDDLNRAVAADPFDQESHYQRGLVLSRLGRADEARAEQERVRQLREDENALNAIRKRLNQDPHNNELRLEIARWLLDHGRAEAGVQWAETILAADPRHRMTNQLLADYYERTGESGRAQYYRFRAQ